MGRKAAQGGSILSSLNHPTTHGPAPQLIERNPELAQLLNNPEMLRESMRVMSNPVRAGQDGAGS